MRKYKLVPLEAGDLSRAIKKLESESDVPAETIAGLKDGKYYIDHKFRIWNPTTGDYVKGTARVVTTKERSRYLRKTEYMDVPKGLSIFDQTVSATDWMEIFANWKEIAKTDWRAGMALFETRFGKPPMRAKITIEAEDTESALDTAVDRINRKINNLRSNGLPLPGSSGAIILEEFQNDE